MEHVNNLVYVKHLENARMDWFEQHDIHFHKMKSEGIGFSLRVLNISFIAEATLGDTFVIKTEADKLGNTSFSLKQSIYNQHDQLIAEAEVVNVMIDFEKRKSIRVID